MPRLLFLGMSALDAIYRVPSIPTTPTKVLATAFAEAGGGMAASASVAAARLGGDAHYWGRLGDDALGERILAQLAREGVDVGTVRRVPECASPSAAILIADDGERLLCTYNDPRLGADPSWLPLERIPLFDAVMADVRWPEGAAAVLDAAARAGKVALLDGDVGPVDALLDLARRATHIAFSEPGLARAAGTTAPGEGLRRIAQLTSAWVGVTLGAEGCLWRDGDGERRVAAPAVKAVDTLGAGDVWHGAFTLALAEGMDIARAARFANVAAALKCTRFGGRTGAPSRAEVAAALAAASTKIQGPEAPASGP
jgi:sugar/nucleoside kinase (ribokinase family)